MVKDYLLLFKNASSSRFFLQEIQLNTTLPDARGKNPASLLHTIHVPIQVPQTRALTVTCLHRSHLQGCQQLTESTSGHYGEFLQV